MDFTESNAREINGIISELSAAGHEDVHPTEMLKIAVSIYNADQVADQLIEVEEAILFLTKEVSEIYKAIDLK